MLNLANLSCLQGTRSQFVNLSTIHIWGWMIFCLGLFYALWNVY